MDKQVLLILDNAKLDMRGCTLRGKSRIAHAAADHVRRELQRIRSAFGREPSAEIAALCEFEYQAQMEHFR